MCRQNLNLVSRVDLASLYPTRNREALVRFASSAELEVHAGDLLNMEEQAMQQPPPPPPKPASCSPARRIEVR